MSDGSNVIRTPQFKSVSVTESVKPGRCMPIHCRHFPSFVLVHVFNANFASNVKAVRHQSECWSSPGGKFPCCIIKSVFFFPYLSSPIQPPLLPHPSIFESAPPHYSFVSQLRQSDPSRLSPLCVILPPPWHLCFWMSVTALICHLLASYMKEKTSRFAILRDCFSSEMWKL